MEIPVEWINDHGGYWKGECRNLPVEDWIYEVCNGDTRLGYWEWVYKQEEGNE